MAVVTLNIPAAALTRIITAVTSNNGYSAIINGTPNPQTTAEFTRQWLITQLKLQVWQYEKLAGEVNVQTDIDTNIVIT